MIILPEEWEYLATLTVSHRQALVSTLQELRATGMLFVR